MQYAMRWLGRGAAGLGVARLPLPCLPAGHSGGAAWVCSGEPRAWRGWTQVPGLNTVARLGVARCLASGAGATVPSEEPVTFQEAIARLQAFWGRQGCTTWLPHNTEVCFLL